MTSDSFAFPAPGRAAWAPKSHRHHHHHHHHDEPREGERHGGGRHGDSGSEGRHGGPRGSRSEGRHGGRRGGRAAKAAFARELALQWAFARGKPGRDRPSPEELEELIALRRMRGGPFAGPGPFGPRGPRGRGRGRGGRARRGDVRLALLRLLAEEPGNGYQLMQTIEERSGGRWRPSPGSVYPTLAQLEDEGLVRSIESDGSRQLEITDAGRAHLETRASESDPWAADDEAGEDALTELGPVIIGLGKAAWQVASVGTAGQRARALELLAETQRGLYRILAEEPQENDADAGDDDVTGSAEPESSTD
jgi:DNA-binding PadR family transcriptional regulator